MDVEEFLKGNNPPRGDTYVFVCGQSFIDDLRELKRKHETTKS